MSPDPVVMEPIRLGYALTPDDVRDGVEAQQRRGFARWLGPGLVVAVLAGVVTGLVAAEVWQLPVAAATVAVGVGLVLAALIGVLAHLSVRFLLAALYRWQAQLLMRGNPWLSQPVDATVTDGGIHLRSATEDARISWSHHRCYIETERSFVLLASKGLGAMSVVLPKRGLLGADPAQLRSVLAAHLSEHS